MASLQPSWLSSFNIISSTKPKSFFSRNICPSSSLRPIKILCSLDPENAESLEPSSSDSPDTILEAQTDPIDPVKLAFSKAKDYKKSLPSDSNSKIEQKGPESPGSIASGDEGSGSGRSHEIPASVKMALEKAKEYKKNQGNIGVAKTPLETKTTQGLEGQDGGSIRNDIVDEKFDKKGKLSISSIDFVGLEFGDKKKTRGLPPGLVPVADPFSDRDLPEVEFIVGDTSKFEDETKPNSDQNQQIQEDEPNLYKPKVSSWGLFPRPGNISKTYGGGRVIRPGQSLETAEEKAAKEARTKELIAAYKKKVGLNIDAKLKFECEEALKDGDSLMNQGKLKDALPFYEKVMDKLTFQSELHGLAALQWSICQDSLSWPNEARVMYEKLQSHPNAEVSKKARQFMFSFQAMEMMKVSTSNPFTLKSTGYQDYFEAFVEKKSDFRLKEDEAIEVSSMNQALLYFLFLVSPIFIVLIFAIHKRI